MVVGQLLAHPVGKGLRALSQHRTSANIMQGCQINPQGNVKVSAKSLASVVSGTLRSEIRISNLETISNYEYQMAKTFQIFIQYLRDSSRLAFWILVIRICFGFRASCFEFIENRISKQSSLSQLVISLNDVALDQSFTFGKKSLEQQ